MNPSLRTLTLVSLALGWCLATGSPSAGQGKAKTTARTPQATAAEIDRMIDRRLAENKYPASPLADDAEFLRRASLDIRGRIPTAERVAAFLNDTAPDKRAKLIDEFLADHEYGEHFAIIWYHRMVKPDDDNRKLISDKLEDWLADSFNKNHGWNRIVTDILTAEGLRDKSPQTVFWLANVNDNKGSPQPEPSKVTAAASRLFLGVKLECCECHNHPFATLKQADFWGTAAFFTNTHADHTGKKDAKSGVVPSIHEGGAGKGAKKDAKKDAPKDKAPSGAIVIPDTKGKTVKAKFLEGEEPALAGKQELRPVFAAWMTAPKNRYFAPAAVNKMWANFFGRGFVDPIDDMRADSANTHPELLQFLSDQFVASGFDLKHLIRCICNSKTYQRSSRALPSNKEDEKLYSHMPVKLMSADMLYDSLAVALGHTAADQGKGGAKKKGTGGARERFRKFFHAEADDDLGIIEDYTHGIPQVLRLMNSPQINDTSAAIAKILKTGGGTDKVIESLYLAVLARRPLEAESQRMKDYVAKEKDPSKAYGDLMWALLNSGEFLFNH